MRPGTALSVYIWGIGLTTAAIAVLTAVLQSRWVMLPLVYAGSVCIVIRFFWRWRTGPFRENMLQMLQRDNHPVVNVTVLAAAVAVQIFLGFGIVLGTRSAVVRPCLCVDGARFHSWWDLTLGGFTFTSMESIGLLVLVSFVYRLFYRGEP